MASNLIFNRDIGLHRQRVQDAKPTEEPAKVTQIDESILFGKLKLTAKRYLPITKKTSYPTLFYVPGTAFVAYGSQFSRFICSHICNLTGYQVIELRHRLAPEHQFPHGIEDAYRLMKFFIKHADEYQIDQKDIAIAGYSTGANFAASMTIQAHKDKLPLHRQILVSPLVDFSHSLSRYKKYKSFKKFNMQDRCIGKEFVAWFEKLYLPPGVDKRDPRISPFWHQNLTPNLPPTDIIVAEFDRYRMDAEAYFDKLQDAGITVNKFVVDNENHSYFWRRKAMVDFVAERLTSNDKNEKLNVHHVTLSQKDNKFSLDN